jgi:O-succinylbenzoate synthase
MKFITAELEEVYLKFAVPFQTGHGNFIHRDIWLLKLTFDGQQFCGEISPLPGFTTETREVIEKTFIALLRVLRDAVSIDSTEELYAVLSLFQSTPAFYSGLEQALLSGFSKTSGQPIHELFALPDPVTSLAVNATVGLGDSTFVKDRIKELQSDGFECIKLKVGRKYLADDISIVNEVFSSFGDSILFRLDANRCWTYEQAITFLQEVNHLPIDYIEEPVTDFAQFKALRNYTHLPLAADESIHDSRSAIYALDEDFADVIIVKPGVLGIQSSLQIIKHAQTRKKRATVTSSLDSPIGKRKAVVTAALARKESACGLDTVRLFENPLYNDIYPVFSAQILCDPLSL